jgi:membrane protease YdiL (CAAX protease family)
MTAWTRFAIAVALIGPPIFAGVSKQLDESSGLLIPIVLQLLYCGLAVFILWVVVNREHLPLRSIGLRRPDWSTLAAGIVFWSVAFYVLPLVMTPFTHGLAADAGLQSGIARIARWPIWFRIVVGATGAVTEELLYRGYAIERLTAVTGRRWLGAAIPAAVFGAAHIPLWGVRFALAADLPFGIVMTLCYLWKRDLPANMLAHGIGMMVALMAIAR